MNLNSLLLQFNIIGTLGGLFLDKTDKNWLNYISFNKNIK